MKIIGLIILMFVAGCAPSTSSNNAQESTSKDSTTHINQQETNTKEQLTKYYESSLYKLPSPYKLAEDKNKKLVILDNNEIIVWPDIVSIGYNDTAIIGCVIADSIDNLKVGDTVTSVPGYFILNRTTKMRVSSIKQHVWDDFKNKIPSLGEVTLTKLKSIKCPI
jgi:hypothetical protein